MRAAEGLIICSNLGGEDELGQHWDKAVYEGCRTVLWVSQKLRGEDGGNEAFPSPLSSSNDSEHLEGLEGKENIFCCLSLEE